MTWKRAGYSSEDIAQQRGTSSAAVDTLFSRAKDKIRVALGIDKMRKTTKPMGRPRSVTRAGSGGEPVRETPDGE